MNTKETNTLNQVDLPYAIITYEEPIVYFVYKEGAELGFPEIRELISCAEKLSGQKPYVTFADVRAPNINITNEGKRMVADIKNMPFFRGTAALLKNNTLKIAANFLSHFTKSTYPFQAFTKKEDAIAWLLSLPLE